MAVNNAIANLPEMTVTKDEGKELYRATQPGILPGSIQDVVVIAKALFDSKLFGIENAAQAVSKIMAGAEMGLPPVASLNAFHIVKGKIMTHYSTIAMGVRRAGYDYRVLEGTDKVCTVEFYNRQQQPIGTFTFTSEDARRNGTQNMDKFPKIMLFARAMSAGARMYVPEAFNGLIVYAHEERHLIEEESVRESFAEQDDRGTSQRVADKINSLPDRIILTPPQASDWAAYCEERGIDPEAAIQAAEDAGMTTVEGLYSYTEAQS